MWTAASYSGCADGLFCQGSPRTWGFQSYTKCISGTASIDESCDFFASTAERSCKTGLSCVYNKVCATSSFGRLKSMLTYLSHTTFCFHFLFFYLQCLPKVRREGDECRYDSQCGNGLYCYSTTIGGKCTRFSQSNEGCGGGVIDQQCAPGLECSPIFTVSLNL